MWSAHSGKCDNRTNESITASGAHFVIRPVGRIVPSRPGAETMPSYTGDAMKRATGKKEASNVLIAPAQELTVTLAEASKEKYGYAPAAEQYARTGIFV